MKKFVFFQTSKYFGTWFESVSAENEGNHLQIHVITHHGRRTSHNEGHLVARKGKREKNRANDLHGVVS